MAYGKVTCSAILLTICAFLSVNGQKSVLDLNENNWSDMLNGEWMVEL